MRNPNGYGSVVTLPGNRRRPYAARVCTGRDPFSGRSIFKYLGYFYKRTEAMNCLAKYNENPYDLTARKLTLENIYELWSEETYLRHDNKIPSNYTSAYKHMQPLYSAAFVDIMTSQMQSIVDACSLSYSTKKNIKVLFNLLSKHCLANGIIQINYAPLVKLPKAVQSRMHVPFTQEEIATLWTETARYEVKLALVYIYTGLRPTELLRVTTENVHLDEHYMRGGMKTEAGTNRVIPIADKIMPFIEEFYKPDNEYLINHEGEPIGNYDRLLNKVWRKNEILKKHHPHDTRHTCATLMDNAGVELYLQQLILGHSAKELTRKVYTHKTIAQLVKAINCI